MPEAFGLYASGELQKGASGTEYMRTEHNTLPSNSDPGTVGETLEAVGFTAT